MPEAVTKGATGCKGNILFVDDERLIIDLWTEILDAQGYHVEWRTTNFDAYRAFQESPGHFDLVITELNTFNIRGLVLNELIKKIRPDIPIIILTGFSYPNDEEEAQAIGVRHFLHKPIKAEKLCQIISHILNEDQAHREPARTENPSPLSDARAG